MLEAIEDVRLYGKAYQLEDTVFIYEGYSRGVLVRVRVREQEVGTAYPLHGDGVIQYFPEKMFLSPF